jgi:hypothetical protein
MEEWTVQELSAPVELYFNDGSSIIAAQGAFRRIFQVHETPSEHVISSCMPRFRNDGTV